MRGLVLVLVLMLLVAGRRSLSSGVRALPPECCQYAIAKGGGAYPLRLVVQGRLPQVCGDCANATFGVLFDPPTHPPLQRNDDQLPEQQPRGRGQGRGRGGGRSVFIRTDSASARDPVTAPLPPPSPSGNDLAAAPASAGRRRVSKRAARATYCANLREAVRPLCQADRAAEDAAVQAMLLSQVPISAVPPLGVAATNTSGAEFGMLASLVMLSQWLHANFRVVEDAPLWETGEDVVNAVRDMRGSELSLAAAGAAILRGAGFACRVVSDVSARVSASHLLPFRAKRAKTGAPTAWAEVWHSAGAKWIRMDAARCLVDDPCDAAEAGAADPDGTLDLDAAWRCNVSHVIAADRGLLTDSTRRYCRKWEGVEERRPPGWEDMMGETLGEASRRTSSAGDEGIEAEGATFREMGAREELPKSLSALRKHPLFVAERLLAPHEILRRGSVPVAALVIEGRSEALFSRDHVELLRTRDDWRRHLRQVLDGEKPVRTLNSKAEDKQGGPMSRMARFQRRNEKQLYGRWQTNALEPGAAIDGRVPTTDRGYVELLTKRHLPVGCTHVDHPAASLVARALKIDHAPAMVGTVHKNGYDRPLFQGIVVCSEFAERLLQGCAAREKRRPSGSGQALTSQKLAEKTIADFRRLVLQVLSRFVLKDSSSGVLQDHRDHVGAILSELQSHLGALRDQGEFGASNPSGQQSETFASEANRIKPQGLPVQIHSVMLVIRELGANASRTPGALQALGLACNRLRIALDRHEGE